MTPPHGTSALNPSGSHCIDEFLGEAEGGAEVGWIQASLCGPQRPMVSGLVAVPHGGWVTLPAFARGQSPQLTLCKQAGLPVFTHSQGTHFCSALLPWSWDLVIEYGCRQEGVCVEEEPRGELLPGSRGKDLRARCTCMCEVRVRCPPTPGGIIGSAGGREARIGKDLPQAR